MARVTRRKFLKVSGAGALAAKAGGMAGILATGRAPAYAQATTVHWLRWNDFVPASDQLLAQGAAARGREGARHQDQPRDGQRQRPAAAHHRGASSRAPVPTSIMLFNNHPQLYADERRRPERRRGGGRQGRGRLLPARQVELATTARSGFPCRGPSIGGMIAYRKSWFEEVGVTKFPDTWEKYREVGKKLKAKGRPLGQTLGHTFGDAPTLHLSLPVVVGRQGGRGRRQDGGHQQQGDHRVRQVHDRLLEGCARRGRPRLGRHQQQPRVPVADHLGDAQRRLDLHRVAAQARQVHHREGRAAEDRHPARAAAQGPGRPVRLSTCCSRTC